MCLHTDKLLWSVYTCSFVSKTASWFILDSWVCVFVSVANSVMCLLCSVCNSFLGCEVCLYNQALKQMLLISIDLSSFCWRSTCKISLRYRFSPMVVSVVAMAAYQATEASWKKLNHEVWRHPPNKGGGNGLLCDSSFNKNCLLGGYRAVLGKLSFHFGPANIFFFIKETSSALQTSGKTF